MRKLIKNDDFGKKRIIWSSGGSFYDPKCHKWHIVRVAVFEDFTSVVDVDPTPVSPTEARIYADVFPAAAARLQGTHVKARGQAPTDSPAEVDGRVRDE